MYLFSIIMTSVDITFHRLHYNIISHKFVNVQNTIIVNFVYIIHTYHPTTKSSSGHHRFNSIRCTVH